VKQNRKSAERPIHDVTINSLFRINLHALLRDRALRDKAVKKHGRNCLNILRSTYEGQHDFDKHINIEEWLSDVNPDRWSRKNFGEWSGVGPERMNRLLDDRSERKPQDPDFADLMKISKALNIPYGFLFYPTRQQLEEEVILRIQDFSPPLEISSVQWMAWASGLSVLPGMDAVATNFNSLTLTTSPMAGFDGKDIQPTADTQTPLDLHETRRISESLTSDTSAALEAIAGNPFSPSAGAEIPFDNTHLEQFALQKAKFIALLLHDVREAFYLTADEGRLDIATADIENSLKKIQQDLAVLALNVDKDLQLASGPLTKAHLHGVLELMCMKLENIDLEWTQDRTSFIK